MKAGRYYLILMQKQGVTLVSRPDYNLGKGFFVLDGKLYDAGGNEFIPVGANSAVFWQNEASDINY